ncbi:TRAP transporter small permease [Oceanobacillus massiliensis]|uniref:TRAP transporter small permease n=2 Tax=Oceanobacillus massiliensis TaxID=1465765 RepID=UPI000289A295|nr:TRAP transporter small permease [Oceanobacillus massiliensis]
MLRIVNYINFGMKHILNLIMAVLVASTFMQVIYRFFLHNPLAWTEELARYCLIVLTFLGAAYAMSLKQHIGIEFIVDKFPATGKKGLQTIAFLICLLFYLLMIVQGLNLADSAMNQLSPVLRIPMGILYMVIPLSGFLLAVNHLANFLEAMKGGSGHDDSIV